MGLFTNTVIRYDTSTFSYLFFACDGLSYTSMESIENGTLSSKTVLQMNYQSNVNFDIYWIDFMFITNAFSH